MNDKNFEKKIKKDMAKLEIIFPDQTKIKLKVPKSLHLVGIFGLGVAIAVYFSNLKSDD